MICKFIGDRISLKHNIGVYHDLYYSEFWTQFGTTTHRKRSKSNSTCEYLGIGKQSISDYEKQKSYPTFANLDKIAEYFNATPTQLFGTSKEIELEKSVLESNEYSDKVSEILKAVKYIENFLETDGQYLEDLLYLTRGKQLYTEDGDELYTDPTSQKRTFHNQYEPGFIVARDKSPLELLIENKELFDK